MNFRRTAKAMADELEAMHLEVALIPAPHGRRKIRSAIESNPDWYQKFCSVYAYYRGRWQKPKTYIKRRETLKWLRRIAAGETSGVYVARLLPVIQRVQKEDAERLAFERQQYRKSK